MLEYKKRIQRIISLSIILIGINIILTMFYYFQIVKTNGTFNYVLDDAYIHLSMAKNLQSQGHWGIRNTDFTNSSSSPLWTTIIAIFPKIDSMIPFYLNFLLGSILIIYLFYLISNYIKSVYLSFLITLIGILAVPIVPLYFTGLEHILHILLMLYMIEWLNRYLKKDKVDYPDATFMIFLFAPIVRLESIFFIIPFIIYLLYKKSKKQALIIIFLSTIVLICFSILSLSKGWLLFPNSIYLKSSVSLNFLENFKFFILQIPKQIYLAPHMAIIILIALITIYYSKKSNSKNLLILNLIILVAVLLCLQFGRTRWFYRYEAFLVAISIFQIIINLENLKIYLSKSQIIIYFLILSVPIFYRGLESYSKIIIATNNIYSQPLKTAEFILRYYKNSEVALNDIGAASLYTNAKIIDLAGLANIEVARLIKDKKFNSDEIIRITKNSAFVAVFNNWFQNEKNLNGKLIKSAAMIIDNNFILGNDTLTFFTNDTIKSNKLKDNFRDFTKTKQPFKIIYY
jgi:hypothetical protein